MICFVLLNLCQTFNVVVGSFFINKSAIVNEIIGLEVDNVTSITILSRNILKTHIVFMMLFS